jgi:hypothetical protein
VFLSLKVYMLVQAQNELKEQVKGQGKRLRRRKTNLKNKPKGAKQMCEDEELMIQINDGEARTLLRANRGVFRTNCANAVPS